jgi:ligand-binding sensor domain-containing protein
VIFHSTRSVLWVLLVAMCAWRSDAMDPNRKLSQYVRERWGSEKGLSGDVEAITQTPDGYLWIGTTTGLFHFDGTNFSLVSDQGGAQLPLLNVLGLIVGDRGI